VPVGPADAGHHIKEIFIKTVPVIALAMLATAAVIAQSGMRPGQWEATMQMQMPNMPAAFQMPSTKTTQCITADQAKDPASAVPRQSGRGRGGKDGCKFSDYKTTGNTTTFTMACTSPDKMTGTGEMTFGDDSYTNTIKLAMPQGEMTMKTTAKRLGDCTEDNPGRGRGLLK
jgi:hypothetical protein